MNKQTETTAHDEDAAAVGQSRCSDLLSPGAVSGAFGSLYRDILVFKVPEGEHYYVIRTESEDELWALYCNDAAIEPADNGELAKVSCLGKVIERPCWKIAKEHYISESMRIAQGA